MDKIFYLPDLGEGLASAELIEWQVNVGDEVTKEQTLCTVETAKAMVEIPSPHTGRLKTLFGSPGQSIATGNPLCEFQIDAIQDSADLENNAHTAPKHNTPASVVGELPSENKSLSAETKVGQVAFDSNIMTNQPHTHTQAMPAVKQFALRNNIDLDAVVGSGPDGAVLLGDLKISQQPTFCFDGLNGNKRSMFEQIVVAKSTVMQTTIMDFLTLQNPQKITLKLIASLVKTLQQQPLFNAKYTSEEGLIICDTVDLRIAVNNNNKLYIPVINDAEALDIPALAAKIAELKTTAAAGHFQPSDFNEGRFIFSNIGSVGNGIFATPVVVPPGLGIVAIGTLQHHPKWDEDQNNWIPTIQLPLSLSFDHRIINGAESALFIKQWQENLKHIEQHQCSE